MSHASTGRRYESCDGRAADATRVWCTLRVSMSSPPNREWIAFTTEVPWFGEPGTQVTVGETRSGVWRPQDRRFESVFPSLTELLRTARFTPVRAGTFEGHLLTWGRGRTSRAWLCPSPGAKNDGLFADHELMLRSFGGIVERANEPEETWLLNHAAVLTNHEAGHDASFISEYAWAFGKSGIPIDLAAHYSIAREANGNTTLCERSTGQVLLFAPDHAFDHVRPLRGCPEYTLYELNGARRFRDWVDVVSRQWLDAVT